MGPTIANPKVETTFFDFFGSNTKDIEKEKGIS
jgi:hypothetical protein